MSFTPGFWPTAAEVTALVSSAGAPLEAGADADLALASAIALLQKRLNRKFTPTISAVRFNGNGASWLPLPPFSSVTLVELLLEDGTLRYALTAEEYNAEPFTETVKAGLRRTRALLWGGAVWPRGSGTVRVTATWGEPVPDDVRQAAVQMAALILLFGSSGYKTRGVQSWTMSGPEGTDTESYGSGGAWMTTANGWGNQVEAIIRANRRLSL